MPLVGIFAADSSQPVEDQPNERFDIEAAKQTARGYARERPANATPERINLQSHNTEVAPGPLTRAITRATTANCREKYAGLGLLGIPLLLKDSVTDGCVW